MTFKKQHDVDVLTIFERKKLVTICAPMVRYSKLQFRTLVREYGCDICFTPMILADSFFLSQKARENEFTTNSRKCAPTQSTTIPAIITIQTVSVDSPVIAQFAANTVQHFSGAANFVAPYCDGIDLNCGCPQRWAKQLGLGCVMLEKPDLIADLVRQCRNQIAKPFSVSVKMRLTKNIKNTVDICKQLENCGVTFLTVHARTSNQTGGAINEDALKLIKENVDCPVVANGGVKTLRQAVDIQNSTNCDGVMVANGLLTNPTLFSGSTVTTIDCVQKWLDICYNSSLDLNIYNLSINETNRTIVKGSPNLTFQCFHHHLVFMLEKVLPKYSRRIFNNLQTFENVLSFLREHLNLSPNLYDLHRFQCNDVLKLCYENKNEVLSDFKTNFNDANCDLDGNSDVYSYEETQGKYFKSVVAESPQSDCDLSDLFLNE